MSCIIQHPELQMLSQSKGFSGHLFQGAPADTNIARPALHNQVYLESPGPFFILGNYNGGGSSSSAAKIDTHNSHIGWFWKCFPSANPEIQEAVIFHKSLAGSIDDNTLVGEGCQCPYCKTDGRTNVFTVHKESNAD